MRDETRVIFVDAHAETTSEKIAIGRFLDGRVSAVIGTHTHVQTADEQIFPARHRIPLRRRHVRPDAIDPRARNRPDREPLHLEPAGAVSGRERRGAALRRA